MKLTAYSVLFIQYLMLSDFEILEPYYCLKFK